MQIRRPAYQAARECSYDISITDDKKQQNSNEDNISASTKMMHRFLKSITAIRNSTGGVRSLFRKQAGNNPNSYQKINPGKTTEIRLPPHLKEGIPVFTLEPSQTTAILYPGKIMGVGVYGIVYTDASNDGWVIKRYHPEIKLNDTPGKTVANLVKHEAHAFRKYYGAGSAQAWQDNGGNFYIRMHRVPGVALESLSEGTLPRDAIKRYMVMLEKLNNANIQHADLHQGNIMWDSATLKFSPVDITDIRNDYYKDKKASKRPAKPEWLATADFIQTRMKTNTTSKLMRISQRFF